MFREIIEARTKKPGNPNAKSPSETKDEKKKKDDKKHKGNKMHEGIEILESVLDNKLIKNLETLAGVNEDDIKILDNGFKFQFERSLNANQCMVVSYMDRVIVEFRKKTDNLIDGKMDRLVFEDSIKPQEFSDIFEKVTGIYLSWLG